MQNRKVIKIGGSNLKKVSDVKRIAEIIAGYSKAPVVVVSAFYGVTDEILKTIGELRNNKGNAEKLINRLTQLKFEYLLELLEDEVLRTSVFEEVKELLQELAHFLKKVSYSNNCKKLDNDFALSFGERLSATIINTAVQSLGNNCQLAFPEKIGLITDNVAGNASIDLEKSKKNLKNFFKEDIIYIVPGFYGVSNQGLIRLLGRGGTDYSAAAIAYCIDASALDIWKDVDGFMTGDPKHIKSPLQVNHLSYLEAAELAYFGAGILHPRTVEPLKPVNIPICIFNVNKDDANSLPQTIIDKEIAVFPKIIKSLTFENQVGILCIKGPGVGFIPGILSEITKILYYQSINISSVITSQISINLLISYNDIDKAKRLIESLDLHTITEVTINKAVSLVAVVGNGMTKTPGVAARVFSAIAEEGINILLSSLGALDVVTYFIVDKKDRERAIVKLHNALFNEEPIIARTIAFSHN